MRAHISAHRHRLITDENSRWWTLGAMCFALFMIMLDNTVVNVALPSIQRDLHASLSSLEWTVNAYTLTFAVLLVTGGRLGDIFGRRRMFLFGVIVFALSSLAIGFAPNDTALIAFRAVQGVGAGGLMVGAQAIVGDVVSPRERGRYQGLFGAVFGVASVIGPVLGGVFVEQLSWHWIFYINLPVGVVALAVVAVQVPGNLRRVHHIIDYLGTAVLMLSASCLVLFTSLGGTTYPWGSPTIIALGVAGDAQLTAVDDPDGGAGTHDPQFRLGPGQDQVGTEVARVHRDVGTAIGLAQHDGQLRDGGGGEGADETGPVADDAGLLLA